MIATLDNLPHLTAFPDGFVDGGACSAAQPPQNAAFGATRIVNGPATRRAGSFCDPSLVSRVSIRAQASAIEPRLIEEFTGLHVKTYGNKTGLAERIGGRPSPRAPAEIARDAFARRDVNTFSVAIAVPIVIAVVISILRRRQRRQCDRKQNREHRQNSRTPPLPPDVDSRNRLTSLRNCHSTPPKRSARLD